MQDISTDLEYIVAYYVLAVAQIGMELTDTVLTIGGHAQNPVLLFLNYLSPEMYSNSPIAKYISGLVFAYSLIITGASFAKLSCVYMLVLVSNQGYVNYEAMGLLLLRVILLSWLPSFVQYALPIMGTSAYLLSTL